MTMIASIAPGRRDRSSRAVVRLATGADLGSLTQLAGAFRDHARQSKASAGEFRRSQRAQYSGAGVVRTPGLHCASGVLAGRPPDVAPEGAQGVKVMSARVTGFAQHVENGERVVPMAGA